MKEPARLLVSLLSATTVAALAPASAGASDEVAPDLEPTLVVAPDGDDSAAGSLDDPFATVQHAVDLAGPGDVISIRGGTYALDDQNITIDTSGTPDDPITLTAHEGERVIIDGQDLPASSTPIGGDVPRDERGTIHQEASHWIVIGLELINGPYGYYCDGCDGNVFSDLVTRENYESGFQLQGESSDNLVLNLDSYGNRDPRKNGESADGLAIKEGSGTGNVVRGARLWDNADDGFDAWEFEDPITIVDSLVHGNGFNRWDLPDFSGDGNGFKLGGGDPAPHVPHELHNTAAWGNAADGYTDNGNHGAVSIDSSTAYDNAVDGFELDGSSGSLTDNLALDNETDVQPGEGENTGNSWNLDNPITTDDLLSTDPSTINGPRSSDGSLPSSDYLVPADHSDIGARW